MITQIRAALAKHKLGTLAENIIIAQAAHESNFFQSSVFRNSNNLFGIRKHNRPVRKKDTLYNTYTSYENIEDSVDDLVDLIRRRNLIKALVSIPVYAQELKRVGYYEDEYSNYVRGMQNAYNKLFT